MEHDRLAKQVKGSPFFSFLFFVCVTRAPVARLPESGSCQQNQDFRLKFERFSALYAGGPRPSTRELVCLSRAARTSARIAVDGNYNCSTSNSELLTQCYCNTPAEPLSPSPATTARF